MFNRQPFDQNRGQTGSRYIYYRLYLIHKAENSLMYRVYIYILYIIIYLYIHNIVCYSL